MRSDMKRALLLLATLLVAAASQAQMKDPLAPLKSYAAKSMARCSDPILSVDQLEGGPANFEFYRVTLRSSDQYCGSVKFMWYSPKTQQIVLGPVVKISDGPKPLAARIGDEVSKAMGNPVTAVVAPFPLPDGLRAVNLTKETPFGPFSYHAFVDSSEQFVILGMRGNLKVDPAQTLRETIGVTNAVRKGNAKAKIEILELSDLQCPSCARAHVKVDPIIEKNLSKVNYGRLDLPLFEHHPWALQAALAARAINRVAPKKYWAYLDHVFKNQEEISKRPFDTFLQEYLEDHDIDKAAVQKIYGSKTERTALLEQVSRAFSVGIQSTPTYIVNGQMVGFGPEGEFTMNAIKTALGLPLGTAAAKGK
jgi:protein-disulfide isomerase